MQNDWLSFDEHSLPLAERIRLHERHAQCMSAERILRARAEHERTQYYQNQTQWQATPEGVFNQLTNPAVVPFFLRTTYQRKLSTLRSNERRNAFLMNTVKKALLRLQSVKRLHTVNSAHTSEIATYYRAIWPHLVEKDRRAVLTLANEIAARFNEMLYTECDQHPEKQTDEQLHVIYCHLAIEAFALRIMAPFSHLRDWRKFERLDFFSAAARLCSADWWGRKLWRLRTQWREQQLRAFSLVHRFASPYISHDALQVWQQQRRKNLTFLQSHELVDEEGNVYSLEAMAMASISNPVLRRHELMARVSGVELVANERGDVGVFLTITAPSKYHANHQATGAMNDKWNHASVEQAHRYLMDTWERAFSALKRLRLRPYGFRVAEPHHDGTPHLHACLFTPKEQRRDILKILRSYFIKEDRAELGKNLAARFKVKYIDPRKGSATSYASKYISKNIDGYALDGELDHESGRPLKETARCAMAWASTHSIRQYQFVGTPPVTPYRELRKLSNQMQGQLKRAGTWKKGQALLNDSDMDKVMAAADAGCFATYIKAQGGVLIPRKNYVVALTYEIGEKLNAYGEEVQKVFGIWSPSKGEQTKICTRLKTFTIRKKAKTNDKHLGGILNTPCGTAAPWSSVNNSTENKKHSKINEDGCPLKCEKGKENIDFGAMSRAQRRELLRRLRQAPPQNRKVVEPSPDALLAAQRGQEKQHRIAERRQQRMRLLDARLAEIGENLSPSARSVLASGGAYHTNTRSYRLTERGELLSVPYRAKPDGQQRVAQFNNHVSLINQILARHNAAPVSLDEPLSKKIMRHNELLQPLCETSLQISSISDKRVTENKENHNVAQFGQKMRRLLRQLQGKCG